MCLNLSGVSVDSDTKSLRERPSIGKAGDYLGTTSIYRLFLVHYYEVYEN
jgi:hypothetical protein